MSLKNEIITHGLVKPKQYALLKALPELLPKLSCDCKLHLEQIIVLDLMRTISTETYTQIISSLVAAPEPEKQVFPEQPGNH